MKKPPRSSSVGGGGFAHRAEDFDDMPIGAAEMGQARLLLLETGKVSK